MNHKTNIKEILHKLIQKEKLSKKESKSVLTSVAKGEVNEYQIASLLTVFQMRAITGEELSGFREAMIDFSVPMDFSEFDTIDIVGTGGDRKNTFNISTLSALVVAGAGYKVAKHGNSGKSSVSGSSDVLSFLGYNMSNDEAKMKKELDRNNFCYMHAPLFHPAMKYVGSIRNGLGVATFFNLLGPLLNPSKPKRQLSGVWDPFILPLYQSVFEDMGIRYAVLHSDDGYDEISLTGPFTIITNEGKVKMSPEEIEMQRILPLDIYGGNTKEEAAKMFVTILEGKGSTAQSNVVYANAAYAIQRFKPQCSIIDCIAEAAESCESGKALKVLKSF